MVPPHAVWLVEAGAVIFGLTHTHGVDLECHFHSLNHIKELRIDQAAALWIITVNLLTSLQ